MVQRLYLRQEQIVHAISLGEIWWFALMGQQTNLASRSVSFCTSVQSLLRSSQNTNVVELYKRLQKDDDQLTYYDSGIGTYVKEGSFTLSAIRQWFDFTIDMAIAW